MVNPLSPGMDAKRVSTTRTKRLPTIAALGLATALVTGFALWPRSPVNLSNAGSAVTGDLMQRWQAGEVVVLVRHAERCDRSSNPCLGPADGITKIGSESAQTVGQAFVRLGMTQADVLTSPVTRTAQTSHYMFGKEVMAQNWLAECGKTMRNDVVAHKRAQHNLLLITHSGCISDFEAQTGFEHAATSEYTGSLFVRIAANGEPEILGILNAEDWQSLLSAEHLKRQ